MSARARKSARSISPPPAVAQVAHRDLHQLTRSRRRRPRCPRSRANVLAGAAEHVDVDVADRAEAAALDQDRLLVEHLGRLQHLPVGRSNIAAPRQAQLHQPQAHQAVVDLAEGDARELDHVDLDAPGGQVVEQRLDQLLGLVVEEEGAVEQVHADDAQRLLLQGVLGVEHAHVDDDLAVLIARVRLEPHAHPAVALVGALEVAGRDGVGEGEEGGRVARGFRASRSRFSSCSWSSIASSRCRQT